MKKLYEKNELTFALVSFNKFQIVESNGGQKNE